MFPLTEGIFVIVLVSVIIRNFTGKKKAASPSRAAAHSTNEILQKPY
jgi:hypothetical protein